MTASLHSITAQWDKDKTVAPSLLCCMSILYKQCCINSNIVLLLLQKCVESAGCADHISTLISFIVILTSSLDFCGYFWRRHCQHVKTLLFLLITHLSQQSFCLLASGDGLWWECELGQLAKSCSPWMGEWLVLSNFSVYSLPIPPTLLSPHWSGLPLLLYLHACANKMAQHDPTAAGYH